MNAELAGARRQAIVSEGKMDANMKWSQSGVKKAGFHRVGVRPKKKRLWKQLIPEPFTW
jgi:hypothetical protein